jgi:hypothetical protein
MGGWFHFLLFKPTLIATVTKGIEGGGLLRFLLEILRKSAGSLLMPHFQVKMGGFNFNRKR